MVGLTIFIVLSSLSAAWRNSSVLLWFVLIQSLYGNASPSFLTLVMLCMSISVWLRGDTCLVIRPKLLYPGLLLAALAVLQAFVNGGSEVLIRWVSLATAVSVGLSLLSRRKFDRGDVLAVKLAFAVLALQSCLAILQFAAQAPLLPTWFSSDIARQAAIEVPGFYRGFGTLPHPNALGILLAMAIPSVLALRRIPEERGGRIYFVLAGLFATGALATLSRSSALAVALAILLLILRRSSRAKLLAVYAAMLLLALVYFVLAQTSLGRFSGTGEVASRDASSNDARMANVTAAWRAWQDAPFLGQGWGSGNTYGQLYGGYPGLGAHNTFLDMLSGGGILLIGVSAFIGIEALRRVRSSQDGVPEISVTLKVVIFMSFFETLLQGPLMLALAVLVAAWLPRRCIAGACESDMSRSARART